MNIEVKMNVSKNIVQEPFKVRKKNKVQRSKNTFHLVLIILQQCPYGNKKNAKLHKKETFICTFSFPINPFVGMYTKSTVIF